MHKHLLVMRLNDNSTITALTVYVSKKRYTKDKLKSVYRKLDNIARNKFCFQRKPLLLSLGFFLFSYTFFYLTLYHNIGNAIVVARCFSDKYLNIYLSSVVFAYLFSNIPIIGKYASITYGLLCVYITSAVMYNYLYAKPNAAVSLVFAVIVVSFLMYTIIIGTLILIHVSKNRSVSETKSHFIKHYLKSTLYYLLISSINFFIFKLFI